MKRFLIIITLQTFVASMIFAQTKFIDFGSVRKIDPTSIPTGFPKIPFLIPSAPYEEKTRDWSDNSDVYIPEPRCAYVNIMGTQRLPEYKGDTLHCWMEVYDGLANYFRKRVILDAQGSSSLYFPKKNIKVDFCDDEWEGEQTPTITIGNWVGQDGFHLKAYYNDYLRGVAVVGYRLYNLMTSLEGRPWTRSDGLAKDERKALCHPDGFPCIVYLDGEFYGIFSWQLKKHRDNMAQSKKNPRHIHLDGTISNTTFWNGDIDWNAFEVRNPKEMTDETRACIESLSQVCNDLSQIRAKEQSVEAIRAEFARRFDLPSLLDYVCLHHLIANCDGFSKNWQWFTYDGVKWFVAPYDLDYTFGNNVGGETISPADLTGVDNYWALYTEGPIYWIHVYFKSEIRERYCQLRRNNMIESWTVKALVHDWYDRVGEENYAKEWEKWKDSKCIQEPQYAWYWKPVDKWRHYHKLSDWDSTKEYKKGDICRLDLCEWEATEDNTGVKPYISLGYMDSVERYDQWIDRRFELMDSYFDYVSNVGIEKYVAGASNKEEWTNVQETVYDLYGNKRNMSDATQKGIHIIKYKNGTVRKVVRR